VQRVQNHKGFESSRSDVLVNGQIRPILCPLPGVSRDRESVIVRTFAKGHAGASQLMLLKWVEKHIDMH
jgi:hypothetical protein